MEGLLFIFSVPLVASGILLCLTWIRERATGKKTHTKTLWLFLVWSVGLFLFTALLWWRGGW